MRVSVTVVWCVRCVVCVVVCVCVSVCLCFSLYKDKDQSTATLVRDPSSVSRAFWFSISHGAPEVCAERTATADTDTDTDATAATLNTAVSSQEH